MNSHPLGTTPLRRSTIGLGCVTFGREIDRAAALAMMDHAWERGITTFDTAAAYAAGGSETIVGEWLASRRPAPGKVMVATKILPPYTPERIEAAVEESARRLKLDPIPLLYVHRWDESLRERAALEALGRLVERGRVAALGASNFTASELTEVLKRQDDSGCPAFATVQNIHNFAVRGVDEPLRRLCRQRQMAIVTYSPLGAGFLSGKHEAGVVPGSRFAIIPGHQAIYFTTEARARLQQLKQMAAEAGVPVTRLALAWALRQPEIACVLVGGRNPAQIDQALDALNQEWPAALGDVAGA